ncbi:MAG: acyltransferase family protein [Gemmatirosa sp.]
MSDEGLGALASKSTSVIDERPAVSIQPSPRVSGGALADALRWLLRAETDARAIAALDGLRGLAASLVFIVHFEAAFRPLLDSHPPLLAAGEYAARVGYHGVNLFFVLSGFLIYGSLVSRPVPLGTYVWRRGRRIYPTYLAVLSLYLVMGEALSGRTRLPKNGTLEYLLQNVLLLPGVLPITPIITVAWSLSFEIFFYVGIAALVMLLRMRRWPSHARAAFFAALLVGWLAGGPPIQEAVRSFVMFVPGILLWELSRSPWGAAVRERTPAWLVWSLVAGALLMAPWIGDEAANRAGWLARVAPAATPAVAIFVVLAVSMPLLLLHALGGHGGVARPLSWEPLRRVGVASYSFYLIHGVTINLMALVFWRLVPVPPTQGWLLYLALLPVVYACSVLTAFMLFRAVEHRFSL